MFAFGSWGKLQLPQNTTELFDYLQKFKHPLEPWILNCLTALAEQEPITNVYHAGEATWLATL